MAYLLLLLIVVLLNVIPAFAPPTWTVLVIAIATYRLNMPATIVCGVVGATFGRYILANYIHWFSDRVFNQKQIDNLSYLGSKLGNTPKKNIIFTFLYSITPLSTTALFVAAGMAKIRIIYILTGFALGRVFAYTWLVMSTELLAKSVNDVLHGAWSWKSGLSTFGGLLMLLVFIFIDWRILLESKKIRLNFRVWKWSKTEEVEN